MNIQKIAAGVTGVCGLFLIVSSSILSKNYDTGIIVKNVIIGLGFLIGGILILVTKPQSAVKK